MSRAFVEVFKTKLMALPQKHQIDFSMPQQPQIKSKGKKRKTFAVSSLHLKSVSGGLLFLHAESYLRSEDANREIA